MSAWQASVGFGPGLRQAGAIEQLGQMRKLADTMDRVKHLDVTGIHFIIGRGSETQIDASGSLWLNPASSVLQWVGCGT